MKVRRRQMRDGEKGDIYKRRRKRRDGERDKDAAWREMRVMMREERGESDEKRHEEG